jgi:TolB protein
MVLLSCCAFLALEFAQAESLGIFESHQDIGTVLHPGSASYDMAKREYVLTASGENVWFKSDTFQFAWKKISGDVALTANVSFLTRGGNEHRKALMMVRQSLDADSAYADIALHGNGLAALQYRDTVGAITQEIQSNVSAPTRLRIVKRGDYVYMSLAKGDGDFSVAGGWIPIPLKGDFYIGIGLCAHDKDVVEKAVFSKVSVESLPPVDAAAKPTLYSSLETIAVASTDRQVVYISPQHFEAPNWTRDNLWFIFNQDGRLMRLPVAGGTPQAIDTGSAVRCNNDHGVSPDGKWIAISDQSEAPHQSLIYMVPFEGGKPRRITQNSPSYWHGWSPDGKTLAFVGQRDGEFDIYSIAVEGGEEKRLTTAKGLDDGPEYSPDGKYIYFNSERTGHMQIWRMRADGSEQKQVFADEMNNWFPHISPDGKWMVFLSYDSSVTGHPESKDVMLRLMALEDRKITVLAKLFGGQGTINVPSWSPDNRSLAFVSYQMIPEEKFAAK